DHGIGGGGGRCRRGAPDLHEARQAASGDASPCARGHASHERLDLSRRDRRADLRRVHRRYRPRGCNRERDRRSQSRTGRDDAARCRLSALDRLGARRSRADAADDADPPSARDRHGALRDLVRYLPRARDGDRLRPSADRHEPLRDTGRRARRVARADFQRRAAVSRGRSRASDASDRVPRHRFGFTDVARPMNDAAVPEIDTRLHDPLAARRAASCGIGFVGPDIPIEVLIASGRPYGHLPWRADRATPWADRWLESSFPYWARSILEQWHDGVFDALDTVVFSRADDASQRLYYYVRELQRNGKLRGPAPRIFDVALIPRESSLAHTEAAVHELMRALDVDVEALPSAFERANEIRSEEQKSELQTREKLV